MQIGAFLLNLKNLIKSFFKFKNNAVEYFMNRKLNYCNHQQFNFTQSKLNQFKLNQTPLHYS